MTKCPKVFLLPIMISYSLPFMVPHCNGIMIGRLASTVVGSKACSSFRNLYAIEYVDELWLCWWTAKLNKCAFPQEQMVKVYSEDGTCRSLEVTAGATARHLCDMLVERAHCLSDESWSLVELHPHLGLGEGEIQWLMFTNACAHLWSFELVFFILVKRKVVKLLW